LAFRSLRPFGNVLACARLRRRFGSGFNKAISRSDYAACATQQIDGAVKKSNGCVCKTQNREACFPSEQVDPAAMCDTEMAIRVRKKRTDKYVRPTSIQEL